MNPEFQDCLKRNKIQSFSVGKRLAEKEIQTAEKDLASTRESFKNNDFKWSTIQSYYSMFHSARALLYIENYREKSHYCLIVAIKALYVDKQLLQISLIESLQKAKTLRENADYYDDWSQSTAESLLKSAEQFLEVCKDMLKNKK